MIENEKLKAQILSVRGVINRRYAKEVEESEETPQQENQQDKVLAKTYSR